MRVTFVVCLLIISGIASSQPVTKKVAILLNYPDKMRSFEAVITVEGKNKTGFFSSPGFNVGETASKEIKKIISDKSKDYEVVKLAIPENLLEDVRPYSYQERGYRNKSFRYYQKPLQRVISYIKNDLARNDIEKVIMFSVTKGEYFLNKTSYLPIDSYGGIYFKDGIRTYLSYYLCAIELRGDVSSTCRNFSYTSLLQMPRALNQNELSGVFEYLKQDIPEKLSQEPFQRLSTKSILNDELKKKITQKYRDELAHDETLSSDIIDNRAGYLYELMSPTHHHLSEYSKQGELVREAFNKNFSYLLLLKLEENLNKILNLYKTEDDDF